MAKGSKRNKERAAAQANKARRVEKRNAAAPKAAAPKAAAPKAASRPSGNNSGLTTTQIRQKRIDKGIKTATKPAALPKPSAASTETESKSEKSPQQIRRQREKKREANAAKRLPNQIAAQNKALKADLKAAEKFNTSFSIDGKAFSYRDPKNLENAEIGSRGDRGISDNKYNPNAYDYTDPLYQYSQGRVSDAARALGIGNVNSQKEVNQILGQIRNPQSNALPQLNASGNNRNNNNNNNKDKNRFPDGKRFPYGKGNRKNISKQEYRANNNLGINNMGNTAATVDPLQVLSDSFNTRLGDIMTSIQSYQDNALTNQSNYEQELLDMRNTLSAQMNPQIRNPIFGIRNFRSPGMTTNFGGLGDSFSRTGGRLGGIRNTTLNLS